MTKTGNNRNSGTQKALVSMPLSLMFAKLQKISSNSKQKE